MKDSIPEPPDDYHPPAPIRTVKRSELPHRKCLDVLPVGRLEYKRPLPR